MNHTIDSLTRRLERVNAEYAARPCIATALELGRVQGALRACRQMEGAYVLVDPERREREMSWMRRANAMLRRVQHREEALLAPDAPSAPSIEACESARHYGVVDAEIPIVEAAEHAAILVEPGGLQPK